MIMPRIICIILRELTVRSRNRHRLYWLGVCLVLALLSGCSLKGWSGLDSSDTHNSSALVEKEGKLRVIYLDVGQGASQLLISPSGKSMLIDGGDNDQEGEMVNYLRRYGVHRLDLVIGTHPDSDHIGGLDAVIESLDIGEIYMPKIWSNTKTFESLLQSIRSKGLKVKTAKGGLNLNWDEAIEVKMLAPLQQGEDNNNMSAVLKVTYGDHSFLFTGDAEMKSEKAMLAANADLEADVLLVGHHGSKSSTTQSFLNEVNPEVAVIQVGDNSYGHPTQTVLRRLGSEQVEIYRNDLDGTIEIVSDGEGYDITTER